ncbi:MAG: TIR domain-containing protein [Acidimicrobiia bacterium]
MPDVFVSYRHSDEDHVALVAGGLSQRGLDVWFDRTDIQAGDRWREEITQGIRDARSVVVAIGPSGIGGVQAFEVEQALDRSVADLDFPIIPLLLPGAARAGDHWQQLTRYSYLEFDDALTDEIVDRIADAVRGLDASAEPPATTSGRVPYPGLRSFNSDETDLFFGRDADARAVLALCRRPGLAAIVGPSGLGKSSLARAGVLPRLVATPLDEVRAWRSVVVTPGHEPCRSVLAGLAVLASSDPDVPAALADRCSIDPAVLATAVLLVLQHLPEGTGLVLLVDQLEEMFTKCDVPEQRQALAGNLTHLAERCPDAVRIIVTMRSDFLNDLLQHPGLARLVSAGTHLLGPLGDDGLRDVIQRPAWVCGARLEPRLLDEILLDVRDQPNALPLLSVALNEMWSKRLGDRLTLRAYAEGGRVTGAIDELAERAIQPFLPTHEPLIRSAVLRLVHLSPGSPPARRRRLLADLDVLRDDTTTLRAIIDSLVKARLVVADREQVELAHDAVISSWHRLEGWVITARAGDEEVRQRVEEAAANWQASDRSEHHLATAGLLAQADPLVGQGRLLLTRVEHDFLENSRRAARRGARRRWLALGSLLVAVAGIAVAVVLLRQNAAQRRENRDAFAIRLAAQAVREAGDRPDLGIRLATLANAVSDLPATRSALLTSLTQPAQMLQSWVPAIGDASNAAVVVPGTNDLLVGTVRGDVWRCAAIEDTCTMLRPASEASSVTAIAASNSGAIAATLQNGTVLTSPSGTGLEPIPTDAPAIVAAVDAGGNLLALGTSEGTIELRTLTGNGGAIASVDGRPSAVAVAPDLNRVAGASTERFGFTLWDQLGTELADVSSEQTGLVKALAFDAMGGRLMVGGVSSGDILVFDVEALVAGGLVEPLRLVGHSEPVVGLQVAGERLVSVDIAGEVRQWDLTGGRPAGPPMRSASPLGEPLATMLAAGLSADGSRVVGVRTDAVVEWDALGRPALGHLTVAEDGIVAVAIDPASDTTMAITRTGVLVRTSSDGTPTTTVLDDASSAGDVTSAVALPEGGLVLGGPGVTIIDPGTAATRARRDDLDVAALALPRDGDPTIAVATTAGDVLLLSAIDLTTVAGPFTLADGPLTDVAVSPDGSTVAAGRAGEEVRTVAVIDVASGENMELVGHGAEVSSIAFSSDGAVLASGSDDRTIILWATSDWRQIGVLTGHTDRVRRVDFDPSGDLLLSAGDDGTMRWWDVSERTPVGLPIRWDDDGVRDVQAGTGVAVSLHGTAAVIWPLDPARWSLDSCQVTARELTPTERSTFAGARSLPTVCAGSAG